MHKFKPVLYAGAAATVFLAGCEDTPPVNTNPPVAETPPPEPEPVPPAPYIVGLLPDTQGGSDATGQAHVSIHPMDELLKHQAEKGVDIVLALGDLTDKGSDIEFAEWRSVADQYAAEGIEFLPVMGNHETSYAYTQNWIANMQHFIPEDAVHMPGYEWVNYYVIRENVLIFGLAYYNLPIAFDWIRNTVESLDGQFDHIVIASHDGLIGAKYGQTREQIVEGVKDDNRVLYIQEEIRKFLARHDVIYVQGHEHQYQRSLITAKTMQTTLPSSSTPTGGNYKMDVYTQIMAGNASYKGYEFRYGERDLVQAIVSQKNATMANGSTHFDVNSSLLTFTGPRVDYEAYYAEHTAHSNDADQDFEADWKLFDKFSRTTDRCETIVYPNSILPETRPVLVLLPEYITHDCYAADGGYVNLVGGVNATFNRTDTNTRDMGYTPGFSRAETLLDLTRLAYQWLFQFHEAWSPNINSAARLVPDFGADELLIPETTIDLKEHVTTSWLPAEAATASDIVIVSGTQNQTGMYQDDFGVPKDIEADAGLALSQTDGGAKQPVVLPATATKSWDISDAVSDAYAVQFTGPETLDAAAVTLAMREDDGWQALAGDECIVEGPFSEGYIAAPPARDAVCDGVPLVGHDSAYGARFWVVLDTDAELALIEKP